MKIPITRESTTRDISIEISDETYSQVQTNGTKYLVSENESEKLNPTERERERIASNGIIDQNEAPSDQQKTETHKKDFHTIHVQLEVKVCCYWCNDTRQICQDCQLQCLISLVMLIF